MDAGRTKISVISRLLTFNVIASRSYNQRLGEEVITSVLLPRDCKHSQCGRVDVTTDGTRVLGNKREFYLNKCVA